MEISKYLNAKLVCSELNAKEKKDVILELANLVKDRSEIKDFDQFVSEVFEREEAMSTGIGHQIAVPHARTEAVNGLIIALGRSKSGIEFEAVDGQPVRLVFLLGTPKKDMGEYLKVLAYLTRILKKDEFREKLLEADDPQEMIGLFQRIEKKDI